MYFIEKFDRENIDGQHLRPPVLAILLGTIERENFERSVKSTNIVPHQKIALYSSYVIAIVKW